VIWKICRKILGVVPVVPVVSVLSETEKCLTTIEIESKKGGDKHGRISDMYGSDIQEAAFGGFCNRDTRRDRSGMFEQGGEASGTPHEQRD
jgi:hypothetical protein